MKAKNLAILATKLPLNMSVTSLQDKKTSGSGKPRYGPPDAPLDSCPLVSALVLPCEDQDPLTLFFLSDWDDYLLVQSSPNVLGARRYPSSRRRQFASDVQLSLADARGTHPVRRYGGTAVR